jgi:hypothetical protein
LDQNLSAGQTAPGQAAPAGEIPRFKRCSVFVMVLCAIFTMGLYISVWYILRKDSLMKLDPAQSKKTDALIKGLAAVHCLCFAALFVAELLDVAGLLSLCLTGMSVYVPLAVRGLLRGYAARVSPGNPVNAFIAPSAVWTCLFGVFYLQAHINRMIDGRLLEAQP